MNNEDMFNAQNNTNMYEEQNVKTKKKRNKGLIITLSILAVIFVLITSGLSIYNDLLKPVNKKEVKKMKFEIKLGEQPNSLGKRLKEDGLIKSEFVYKVYLKLEKPKGFNAGVFELDTSMSLPTIVNEFTKVRQAETINLTFIEGMNINQIADVIIKNTDITKEEIESTLKNEEYINGLMAKYPMFLNENIKLKGIIHPLEGYLFPETYNFIKQGLKAETIFNTMLEQTQKILDRNKELLEKASNKYGLNVNQLMTLASVVELECKKGEARPQVAGVFYNRLSKKMPLQSDITTYYMLQIPMYQRDLTKEELNRENPYNTRGPKMEGKLPIGPVCSPSENAIKCVLEPVETDALFFVSDKNGKIYFTKTYAEHNAVIQKLVNQGLWFVH